MRESVTYQGILQEGLERGIQQGRQEGELTILRRQITCRFGGLETQLNQ